MRTPHRRWRRLILLLAVALPLGLTGGCRSDPPTLPLATSPNNPYLIGASHGASWWRCKFKLSWPAAAEPDAAVDLYLAHGVIAPVLARHIADIPYWRFHRRAARDTAGHQFAFLFYAKPEAAAHILGDIQDSALLKKATAAQLVEQVTPHDLSHPGPSDISEPSDPRWSPSLRKNWPSYIMGVSALWLGLVDDAMGRTPQPGDDVSELLKEYREADRRVMDIWRKDRKPALLQSMGAIFGYVPTQTEKELENSGSPRQGDGSTERP